MFEGLSAGIARSEITPPVGISLSGYASRPTDSAGVHDDLFCKVVVFSNGETKAAIIALDLLGLNSEQVAKIRTAANDWLDIPGSNVFVSCSHTHAGPATQLLRFCGTPDEEYLSWMLDEVVETIEKAKVDLHPCEVRLGEAVSDLAMNRRYPASDGTILLADNEGGFRDTQVKFVRVIREGRPGAVVYNYACHGVVLGNENVEISADWIGAASHFIERSTGDLALFCQGCCGNMNPRMRGGFDVVETAGELVGSAVTEALVNLDGASPPRNRESVISAASKTVELPFLPLPTKEELLAVNAQMHKQIEAARKEGKPEYLLDWVKAQEEWSRVALERVESGKVEKSIAVEIGVLRIDGFRMVAIPGEVFAEFGHAIKSSAPDAMVAAYTNGNIGYVPTADAYEQGGYEVDSAYKLYGVQMIGPESEGIILKTAKELLSQV